MVGAVSIPADKIKKMAEDHWGIDALTEYHWEKVIQFAHLVEKETHRRTAIENTRMGCLMNGGHSFTIHGEFGDITCSGGEMTIDQFRATGQCQNCDAVLGISYREDL